jgi:quinone-modifying oxidoreductase, subunit QmoC
MSFLTQGVSKRSNGARPTGKSREVTRRVKYESELDLGFGERIASEAYGQKLLSCIQCGTCSATCPLSYYMDYTPRRVIAMVREGFKEEVINSFSIWLCASCYSCTVQCPRQIHITDVMYTLKREAMAQGVYPKRYPIPILARAFFDSVKSYGRNSESWLLLKLYFQTNPLKMFKDAKLGLKLLQRGRLSLKRESIKGKENLRALLNAVDKAQEEIRQ